MGVVAGETEAEGVVVDCDHCRGWKGGGGWKTKEGQNTVQSAWGEGRGRGWHDDERSETNLVGKSEQKR
jgi:hypothetical protein